MTQKKIKWTTQQSRAITEHGRSVFVSASAGTGKTAVLSGSCVDVVANPDACPDVFSVLVVTFTDMAAEQMRARIAGQLNSVLESITDPAIRRHLRHQLILLGAADISTIHSFCKRLIAEHFYKLELDPTFAILDADEAKLLKAETLEKTIDWAWDQPDIAEGLRQLLNRRDLRMVGGFPSAIIEISDFLDGIVSRDDWLKRAQILTEAIDPFDTDLAQSQKQIIAEKLQDAVNRIRNAEKIYRNASTDKGNVQFEDLYVKPITGFLESVKTSNWRDFSEKLQNYSKPRVETPKDIDKTFADFIHSVVKQAVDSVEKIQGLAILNPEYLNKFTGAVSRQTRVLVELVRQFDRFYSQAKRTINCLDFADLEHNALRLLTHDKSSGEKLEPSQTALALRKKYKYVFVDECQDINGVQQAILDMVSTPGNLFAVGDPKQSIYQWRGARPKIFIERLKQASGQPGSAGLGLRVDLNINFRSVKPVLDFVNKVFARIMTASFTNIDYDESAYLRPADCDAATSGPAIELHLLDKAKTKNRRDDEQTETQEPALLNDRQLQAVMIARRIQQMVGADTTSPVFKIPDKQTGGLRPVEYRDIVILMRSLAGKGDFLESLRLSGIPVSCEATAGYFEATEITDMLCLLKVLDNPRRDIELAAVLRSPFFRFSNTELAKIRLYGKKDSRKLGFYDCVIGCFQSQDEPELADKLGKTLAILDEWRTVARRGRLAEVIWHIYRQSGLLSFVCAMPDGPARRANLLKLHDRAVQFESFAGNTGVPSLTRFIEFIEKLLAAGQDWSPAEPETAAGNAVRVLSVHKSKGLEFPVVFIADLDSTFSKKDSKQDCLVDEQSTLGLRIIDTDTNSRLDSLAYQVIEEHARRKSLAEEMRILYVAMTRAIHRLILVGCTDKKSCQNILTAASFFDGAIPHWHLNSCKSHLDWVLSALSNEPLLHKMFQTGLQVRNNDDGLVAVQLYDQPEMTRLSALIQKPKLKTKHSKLKTKASKYDLAKIEQSLNWQYQFGDAPLLPAKRSVTQFTHRNDEFTKLDYSASLGRRPKALVTAEKFDGRNIGTVTHLVLSKLDFGKPITAETISQLIDKLVADDAVAGSVASHIDVGSIMKFFETDLGEMTFDKSNCVFREWPFTFALPASEWSKPGAPSAIRNTQYASRDTIIIQGIIDLLIQTPKGIVIIDFKTDNVTAEEVSNRADMYRRQLDFYARAANTISGEKVLNKWLYFLRPGCKIEV